MTSSTDLAVIILAAGMGTRMRSKRQKILHEVGGRPMVVHAFDTAAQVAQHPPVLVIGVGGEGVRETVGAAADYVVQDEQLGTGHATRMAADLLHGRSAQVAVTYADMPLLRPQTLAQLAERQAETGAAIVMLSVQGEATSSFGRVVRGGDGSVLEIVEVAEARQRPNAAELLAITELNVGVYCFAADWLWDNLPSLPPRMARGGKTEYYLTDMIEIAVRQGGRVDAIVLEDAEESLGAGTRAELVEVEKAFRRRANAHWLANGVTLVDPGTIYIDQGVCIGRDTVIWPNSYIQGNTVIGEDCIIGPNTLLRDAAVGDRCRIEQAQIEGAEVATDTAVKPFTHLVE